MRVLFATDLHGLPRHLQELADWAGVYRPNLLLVGGDALPDGDVADPVGTQVRFLLTEMRRHFEVIKDISPDSNIATIVGNHDWLCTYDAMIDLERDGLLQILPSDNAPLFGEYSFVGYSYTPPCPYAVKDFERLDFPGQPYLFDGGVIWDRQRGRPVPVNAAVYLGAAPSLQEDLARVPVAASLDWILVSHAPPFETDLDILPEIGHVGSRSIKDFILQRQPLLSLHGHIHESPGLSGRFWQRLGRTIAVNPGQRDDGLAAVLIDLAEESITLTPLGIAGASGGSPVTLARPAAWGPA